MTLSSSRAIVKVSMLSLFLGALFLSWVVGVLGLDFRGMAPMGRISARREKRQFEVQRSIAEVETFHIKHIVKHIKNVTKEAP